MPEQLVSIIIRTKNEELITVVGCGGKRVGVGGRSAR